MVYDKNKFKSVSPILVSFDSVDIANGTGYEDYFLIESEDSSGKDYHLTPNNDFSSTAVLTRIGIGSINENYDLTPFVFPRTINGTVLISLAVDGEDNQTTWTVTLYRWDGSNQTQIGSAVSLAPGLSAPKMLYMRIPIVNELFPVGESLRCFVQMNNAGVNTARLGIDPAGRTDVSMTITTTSKISVPFNLDL